MASAFYSQARAKELLNIKSGDSADDTELDAYGAVADQHIDNILKQQDERIPLSGALLTAELIQAACYYVASVFRGKRGDMDAQKFWMAAFDTIIAGVVEERSIEGLSYDVQRFNDRYRQEDIFRLW